MKSKGAFTAEACVLVPFLLTVTVLLIYLGIYVYDKTILSQDIDSVVALVRDECMRDDKTAKEICEAFYDEVNNEHPYLALKDLQMSMEKEGKNISIVISGVWQMPVIFTKEKRFETRRDIKEINVAQAMFTTKSIENILGVIDENKNDKRTE